MNEPDKPAEVARGTARTEDIIGAASRQVAARHEVTENAANPGASPDAQASAAPDSQPGSAPEPSVFDPAMCGTIATCIATLAEARAQRSLYNTGMRAINDRDFVLAVVDDCSISEKEMQAIERIGCALGQKYQALARWSPEAAAVLTAGMIGSRYVKAIATFKRELRARDLAKKNGGAQP